MQYFLRNTCVEMQYFLRNTCIEMQYFPISGPRIILAVVLLAGSRHARGLEGPSADNSLKNWNRADDAWTIPVWWDSDQQ